MNDLTRGEPSPCAHMQCEARAIIRLGTAKLCRAHYDRKIQHDADEFCQGLKLFTRTEKMAFCTHNMRGFGKVREPGEDDE